jgi:hypothetical protein
MRRVSAVRLHPVYLLGEETHLSDWAFVVHHASEQLASVHQFSFTKQDP